jgi:hypothetical protein
MKEQLQQTIEFLRQHVLKNIELIKANEVHIKEVLGWPLSNERTNELNESYQYSKKLLTENNEFINLQVSIMNFMNKYKVIFETSQPVKVSTQANNAKQVNLSRDDYFRLTIENDISFDHLHPYFNDKAFYNDLFTYYQEAENYEMCAFLKKLKQP